MFILAVIDSPEQRHQLHQILAPQKFQMDFAGSEEDLVELCRQMEPDALLMRSEYTEVSAKYILKHLPSNASEVLPEKVIILTESGAEDYDFQAAHGIHAQCIHLAHLIPCLLGEPIPEDAESSSAGSLPQKKILHISDDRLLRKVVADIISRQTSYHLESAVNGEEGIKLYTTFQPDLILTDWDLPDIDGIELCRRIKMEQHDETVRIALFSSMSDEQLIEAAYQAHAKAYILKPVKPELLLSKIVKMLEGTS